MVDKTTNANSKDAIGLEQKIRHGYFWNKHFCMYVSDYYNYYFFWFLLVTVDRDIINLVFTLSCNSALLDYFWYKDCFYLFCLLTYAFHVQKALQKIAKWI